MGNKESGSAKKGELGANPLGIKFSGPYSNDENEYGLKFEADCSVTATVNGKYFNINLQYWERKGMWIKFFERCRYYRIVHVQPIIYNAISIVIYSFLNIYLLCYRRIIFLYAEELVYLISFH